MFNQFLVSIISNDMILYEIFGALKADIDFSIMLCTVPATKIPKVIC